jgi:large subunit ribosomal protein L23
MATTHDHYQILRRPLITEKGVILQDIRNQYVFLVHPKANKIQIREAVEGLFKVKVLAVNTMNRLGKLSRVGWKVGRKKGFKKAIVTLAEGQAIEIAS